MLTIWIRRNAERCCRMKPEVSFWKGSGDLRIRHHVSDSQSLGLRGSRLRGSWHSRPFAFADDGCTQASAEVVRQLVEMGFPVDLDGHLGGVANDVAVVAPLKMVFQFGLGLGVHRLVEVVG